ncbi:hypothetical protein [Parasitella parasitica]|uniref:Uncharacterized protein n=1 Tax=Parasitella parasitica TaxID=35722 RepID=A0A0B7NRE2_9FUNG|nr:hypothetical protein [Parasitella parasitica]
MPLFDTVTSHFSHMNKPLSEALSHGFRTRSRPTTAAAVANDARNALTGSQERTNRSLRGRPGGVQEANPQLNGIPQDLNMSLLAFQAQQHRNEELALFVEHQATTEKPVLHFRIQLTMGYNVMFFFRWEGPNNKFISDLWNICSK